MTHKTTCCGTILIIHLIVLLAVPCHPQQSPCPDIFSYRVDRATGQVFGFVEIRNIQVGQTSKLNVNLFIAAQLPPNNVGSINLIKSEGATFNDIVRGQPAQYRVNFPLQNILPTLVSITLNGQTICSGHPPNWNGPSTTIFLDHTLCTLLGSPNDLQSRCHAQSNPVYQTVPTDRGSRYPVDNTPVHHIEPVVRFQPDVEPQHVYRPPDNTPTYHPHPVKPVQPQPRPSWSYQPQTAPPPRVIHPRPQIIYTEPATTTAAPPPPPPLAPVVPSTGYPCGRVSSAFLNRLAIKGELVSKGQFPWIVPLFDRSHPQNPMYICGSTIITNRYLLTAAHCVFDLDEVFRPQRVLAVPGMYNVDNFFDENALIMDVDQIVPHEDYIPDDDTNDADVAALRMKNAVEFTDYIIPICTWQGENDVSRIVGQEGFVAGWGHTETGSTAVPMFVRTTVVDRKQCNAHLQRNYQSHARVFCGDGHGTVPCNGDSGSGMIIRRGNQYFLRGVVSKGLVDPNTYKCDATRYSVYVDVALFRFWLRKVTQN
uniref:Serine protease gd n=1 Tax=Culex pipiens TaxID=7175 RepID=A0A8D8K016_CULPI